ncbi:hypothetical protein AKJ09_05731 [Labilithrix luteola]|uniref:Uncharacterized protein n=1 Tax=Labilithrix luteola TaxID=1391654 RepID=A0A0K1PZZ3_9BACT|nr:hypothetical protein AKJ09_05731 [Labilithrix luteola]
MNDFALKRSPMAGAVTGKLSDFAGLIVAPVLVASLVRPKSRGGGLACLASVAVPFIAIKLSSKAASLLVWAASLGGLSWRIWSDGTDLAALAVLPLAWRISRCERAGREPFRLRRAVHRLGALLGAFACVATSRDVATFQSSAYLINLTHRDVDVVLFRANVPPDCAVVATAPQSLLQPENFVFDRCWSAPSADSVPLDSDWRDASDKSNHPDAGTLPARACDAVIVRIAGMPDTAVFWNQISKVDSTDRADRADPHALLLEQVGELLVIQRTSLLDTWSVEWTLPPMTGTCEHAP